MQISCREFPADRRFGIELEVSNTLTKKQLGKFVEQYELQNGNRHKVKVTAGNKGWAESRRNAYWHVKYDSTCGLHGKYVDYGWEIASYIGTGPQDLEHISDLANHLACNHVEVNNNCGLHVHVDAADLDPWRMGVLLARWVKIEMFLTMLCPMRRWENPYCRTIRHRMRRKKIQYSCDQPALFWSEMAPMDFSTHNNEEKKYTLNTVGYAIGKCNPDHDRQTVELRLPECVLSTEHVLNWARLIVNFVDYMMFSWYSVEPPQDVSDVASVTELLSLVGLAGLRGEFLMLDNPLWNTKCWLLNKIIHAPLMPMVIRTEAASLLRFISKI